LFCRRVLPFDEAAAMVFATLISRARAAGRAIGTADGQIAATASANGMIVATRDVRAFEAAGVKVINPWEKGREEK
jgi:predicted nucleic acid-binding protein